MRVGKLIPAMSVFYGCEINGDGAVVYVSDGKFARECMMTGIMILHEDYTDFHSDAGVKTVKSFDPAFPKPVKSIP